MEKDNKINRITSRIKNAYSKITGSAVDPDLASYRSQVQKITDLDFKSLTDEELQKRFSRLGEEVRSGRPARDFLIEAYALIAEACRRLLHLDPFEVQLIAAVALHQGKIIELPTGEGKTLAAVFPACLNALSGKGVHILTFNDYLARRDASWMGPVYAFFGLSVGCIQEGRSREDKKQAYQCDVTYATAKEAGFDYLRDQLAVRPDQVLHRPFHFALVDEADSILIDEARIPLVIAGLKDKIRSRRLSLAGLVKTMQPQKHYHTDPEGRNVFLTDEGAALAEEKLGCGNLYAEENTDILTALNCAVHAEALLARDKDYIVRKGKIEIVDEFTGRVVDNRHWPDGLQEAVEAKENLTFKSEGKILNSITLQHYFRLYPRLCGMTATAASAASEFQRFYDLEAVIIPPHTPCIRVDHPDRLFRTKAEKERHLVEEIKRVHASGRPVLAGTGSVAESETLAAALSEAGVECEVLNAKNDEREARIIADAGAPGAVTISTNMAGRGTDIRLGGREEKDRSRVVELGGLYVIGTNRHESIRIDQQLRGRAGRQGDPGSSRFFISLEDDIVVRYGIKEAFEHFFQKAGDSVNLNFPGLTKEIARSQRIIEGQNFEIRKTLWNYSDLIEKQRRLTAEWRQDVLTGNNRESMLYAENPPLHQEFLSARGAEKLEELERRIILLEIDAAWCDHLAFIQDLRESIHLVSVGGKTPLEEFRKQVTAAFLEMQTRIRSNIVRAFENLREKKHEIDLESTQLRGPSSTWTYLINDDQFGWGIQMLSGRNIGFAVAAGSGINLPIFLLLIWLKRFFRRKSK
jgi:preprotein translocase subunit SecA